MSTRRILSSLTAFVVTVSLLLAQPASVGATPPIAGDTLDFAAASAVGDAAAIPAVALGDLDNDGDLDAVSGSAESDGFELIVWENDGSPFGGAWTPSMVAHTSSTIRAVGLGDLDNDGDLDVVTVTDFAGADPEVIAWQNHGVPFAGGWTQHVIGHVADNVNSVALGDLDNDGWLDVVTDGGLEISAWQNDGDPFGGAWTKVDIGVADDNVWAVALGDLDGDGDLDVASASLQGEDFEIIVWENNSHPFGGLWTGADVGASDNHSTGLALADLDGDGDLDIASAGGDGVRLWQNDGDPFGGLWQGHLIPDSENANVLVLADLDGDADPDLVSSHMGPLNVQAWQNDGSPFSGPWATTVLGAVANTVHRLATGDLDNDGDLDVVAGSGVVAGDELTAWENTHVHRNTLFLAQPFAAGAPGADVLALVQGDLDGDGDLDVITAGEAGAGIEITLWQNNGAPFGGAWPASGVGDVADTVHALALGDLDGDGDLDLVSVSGTGAAVEIMAWENGLNPFAGPWDSLGVGTADDTVYAVALADLDGDGDLDIVTGAGLNAFEVMVWMNDSTPFDNAWNSSGVGETNGHVRAVAVGDLDNDGIPDIVTGSSLEAAFELIAWRGDATPFAGLWASNPIGTTDDWVLSLALGDLDNDGDLDLVSGSASGALVDILAWGNDGSPFTGLWPNYQVGGGPGNIYAVQLGDLDADGDLDLVTASGMPADFELNAWLNNGASLGGPWAVRQIGATADNLYALALADLDGDGDLDILTGGGSDDANEVLAWKNIGGSALLTMRGVGANAPLFNADEGAVLGLAFGHNGITGDAALELSYLNLTLLQADCLTPLDDVEANAVIDNVRVRLDDGDQVFETSDTLVADIGALALNGGVQQVVFADGDANAQVAVGAVKTYWVSLLTTADATAQGFDNLCLQFNPDADALIEAKGTADYSVSIQDTNPAAGLVPINMTVFVPLVLN